MFVNIAPDGEYPVLLRIDSIDAIRRRRVDGVTVLSLSNKMEYVTSLSVRQVEARIKGALNVQ